MIIMRPVLSARTAFRLVDLACAHAEGRGWPVACVVTDPDGTVLASLRLDGVGAHILGFATDKAYTAALMRKSTQKYFEETRERDDSRMVLANRPRLIVWSGGLPVKHDGVVVGGIGVSGVKGVEDVECAETALRTEGFTWE